MPIAIALRPPVRRPAAATAAAWPASLSVPTVPARRLECADEDEDEDLGDEEDLAVAQPLADDEESAFDDFDDEFDDDFEEEENDPDWDHPDDADGDELPPGKPPGRRK